MSKTHWLYRSFANAVKKPIWRMDAIGPLGRTLLVASVGGDDVATLQLADLYRDAGLEERAMALPGLVKKNRERLNSMHVGRSSGRVTRTAC